MRALLLALGCAGTLGLVAAGCSEASLGLEPVPGREPDAMDAGSDAAQMPDAEMPDAAPQGPSARVIQVSPWPGRGVQIAVELSPAGMGVDLPKASLIGPNGQSIEALVQRPSPEPGMTALLIVPALDPSVHAQRLAAAKALIEGLPAEETVLVFIARDTPVLLADRSADRAHALQRLAEIVPEGGWNASALLSGTRAQLADCGVKAGFLSLYRSLVVVGENASDDPALVVDPIQTFSLNADMAPDQAASDVLAQMKARRDSIVRIGACAGLDEDAPFTLKLGETSTLLDAPAPIEHLLNQPCQAEEASFDDYPYPYQIDLAFSPDERVIYDDRIAQNSDEPFRTSLKLGHGTLIGTEAHLHGQGSLFCERKSLTIHLDGKSRRLMPGVMDDHFFLVSMCLDERYFGQVYGDRLLSSLGLFPARVRYVRLKIDGQNQGVYLMVERPEDAVRQNLASPFSVIRRRYDSQGEPAEVKHPEDPVLMSQALSAYDELASIALNAPASDIEKELDARLDLDGYLRWLAAYSVLKNGDFIDEAFFYASAENGALFHRVMGWDLDDLNEPCHNGGFDAISDTCSLTYCAEAQLDQALIRSPEVYQRYLQALSHVLAVLTPEKLQNTMNDVKNELFQIVSDDETCAALVEMVSENPAAVKVGAAQADISAHMKAMLTSVLARRSAVENGLGMCVP